MNSSQEYKPKLVICLSRFPFPLEKGDKLRAFYQIIDLSEHFDIYLFCTTDCHISTQNFNTVKKYCKEINVYKLKKINQFWNLFINIFTQKPFQVAYFTQNWIKKKIEKRILNIKPSHIYCQLIRSAEYVKKLHEFPKTIDIMDALSKGMERRISDSNFLIRKILEEEAFRLKKYETRIIDYFNHKIIISEQDKKFIIHPKVKEIKVLPNGVGADFLNYESKTIKEIDILFTGNMSYAPNIKASRFIYNEIFPTLKNNNTKIKITLAGANPTSELISFQSENFQITGWVDDLKPIYAKSKIFLAPMFSGSGMQNKLLEAMAMGIPCVTTDLANNAILAKNENEIIIANTKEDMILAIQKLNNDEVFYQKISLNAKEFVKLNYNWKNINAQLIPLFENK